MLLRKQWFKHWIKVINVWYVILGVYRVVNSLLPLEHSLVVKTSVYQTYITLLIKHYSYFVWMSYCQFH